MAPGSIIRGHRSRGTPASGSRPDSHDGEQRDRTALSRESPRSDRRASGCSSSVIHGDDQVVPFEVGGKRSAERVAGAQLNVYPGAPDGITDTHKDRLNNDLLELLTS